MDAGGSCAKQSRDDDALMRLDWPTQLRKETGRSSFGAHPDLSPPLNGLTFLRCSPNPAQPPQGLVGKDDLPIQEPSVIPIPCAVVLFEVMEWK